MAAGEAGGEAEGGAGGVVGGEAEGGAGRGGRPPPPRPQQGSPRSWVQSAV